MPSKKPLSQKEQIEKAFASFFETMNHIHAMNTKLFQEMQTALDKQQIHLLKKSSKLG